MEKKDVYICRCEEITEGEVLKAIERGARDIDGVKRLTRAGMGLCQGKTCGRLVMGILLTYIIAMPFYLFFPVNEVLTTSTLYAGYGYSGSG